VNLTRKDKDGRNRLNLYFEFIICGYLIVIFSPKIKQKNDQHDIAKITVSFNQTIPDHNVGPRIAIKH